MAEPELYLSLLSSRYAERRDNDVGSRILQVDKPFHKNPDLLDVLDALAAICVQRDVFFVSLAMDTNAATLYVSTNGTVPATVIDHLHTIRRKLKELKPLQVLDFASSPPPNTESPVPNNSQIRSEVELDIQRIIYKYCYKKVQRRFRKRGPEILAQFDTIVESLQQHNRRCRYQTSRSLIDHIHKSLQDSDQKSPQELRFPILIKMIDTLSRNWKKHLGAVGKDGFGLLTQWDSLTSVKKNRHLSLRRFFQKLFTLHYHTQTILRIAWSKRLSLFLDGQFDVVPVPAACSDISIKFSRPKVLHVAFPDVEKVAEDVKQAVCNELLSGLLAKAKKEGIELEMKEEAIPELSLRRINVHAESSLSPEP